MPPMRVVGWALIAGAAVLLAVVIALGARGRPHSAAEPRQHGGPPWMLLVASLAPALLLCGAFVMRWRR